MSTVNLCHGVLLVVLLATSLLAGQMTPLAARPPAEPESISGSYVYLNSVISPDDCFSPARSQTFCLQAISYTDDWDYVFYVWLRFPDDWQINNVYTYDTPYCVHGGTFGDFSWQAGATPNEARIAHIRFQANPSDACTAYYCVDVTSGHASPGIDSAGVSWYWLSSGTGSPPFYPCSADGYTPTGQAACDEMTTPPAWISACPVHVVYLPVVFKNWP